MEYSENKIQEIKNRFGIAGNSDKLNHALEMAIKVAPADITVLLIGESGVGKEAFSKIIHHLSNRKHNHFIPVNCGAIPEGTIDSELFGHEKGAFTSAHESRKGYFETANGGSIFLDEVGEMPLNTQSRLLRVLENGEYLRVGSSNVKKTDVRVVTATNKDLYDATKQKKFREDLYYRLSSVTIRIPALRERTEDIPFLFARFVSDASEKFNVPPLELSDSGERMLKEYKWPGNIRQLKNIIEQISILEKGRTVDAAVLQNYLPVEPGEEVRLRDKSSSSREEFKGFEEKELLYKFLFEIKRDISELKDFMRQAFRNNDGGSEQKASDNVEKAMRYLNPPKSEESIFEAPPHQPVSTPDDISNYSSSYNDESDRTIEASVESDDDEEENNEEEVFSLASKEKEMIAKALRRFKGKRKIAARELGISERTLYRKIKEYELEDL